MKKLNKTLETIENDILLMLKKDLKNRLDSLESILTDELNTAIDIFREFHYLRKAILNIINKK